MNETTNEVMENNEVTEMMVGEPVESGASTQTMEENETSGKGLTLLLTGVGLAVAGGIAAAKKIKAKKNGKPKKKKGHWKLVRVEDLDETESDDDYDEYFDEEDEKKVEESKEKETDKKEEN